MTGPLVGTSFPGSSRFVVCAKSPLTGIWGESASGGAFGADLKKGGIDGLIIKGAAGNPVYLLISDGGLTIEAADSLWHQDTYQTVDILKQTYQDDGKASVLSIGPAGENLVKFASVCNDKAHHLGRTGMGAVMGSKNLKALVAIGNGKVPLAHESAFKNARKKALDDSKESMIRVSFNALGTAAAMEVGLMTGDVPIKNWSVGDNDEMSDAIGGSAVAEKILKKRKACYACPVACKPEVEISHTKYAMETGPGPEYETIGAFGSMLLNLDLNSISKANEVCNRLGMDTITCGGTIAFIAEAFEKGLLTIDEIDGLDIQWGQIDWVMELLEKTAYRQGFGNKVAEGSAAMAKNLPETANDFLVTVKNLELPMHDPRGFHGMGLAYMMSNRGACHLQHSCQAVEMGMVDWTEAGLKDDYEGPVSEGKAEMVCISENIGQMANSLCVCHFVHWAIGMQNLLDGFNAVTGFEYTMEDFKDAGARAWMIKRALNNRMGVSVEDDKLTRRIMTALPDGGAAGSIPNQELMRTEYYEIRGLATNGVPKPEKLDELGLGFLKEKMS